MVDGGGTPVLVRYHATPDGSGVFVMVRDFMCAVTPPRVPTMARELVRRAHVTIADPVFSGNVIVVAVHRTLSASSSRPQSADAGVHTVRAPAVFLEVNHLFGFVERCCTRLSQTKLKIAMLDQAEMLAGLLKSRTAADAKETYAMMARYMRQVAMNANGATVPTTTPPSAVLVSRPVPYAPRYPPPPTRTVSVLAPGPGLGPALVAVAAEPSLSFPSTTVSSSSSASSSAVVKRQRKEEEGPTHAAHDETRSPSVPAIYELDALFEVINEREDSVLAYASAETMRKYLDALKESTSALALANSPGHQRLRARAAAIEEAAHKRAVEDVSGVGAGPRHKEERAVEYLRQMERIRVSSVHQLTELLRAKAKERARAHLARVASAPSKVPRTTTAPPSK